MANLVSFLASELYDMGEWFHNHSPFFKRTNNIVENFNNGEGCDVDNRGVSDKNDAKTTFFRYNAFHLGIIVVYLQHKIDTIMAYSALEIANKLLAKSTDYDAGELMSNMKLQKMLYYQQGYHLAAFDSPLFDEEIEAWMYGPVVPSVYEHFRSHGAGGIAPETSNIITLSEEEEFLFNDVFEAYIDFSAYGLMNKTHGEMPWRTTNTGIGNVISHEKMTEFFKKKFEES